MPLFDVPIVKTEKLLLWNDFWKKPRKEWTDEVLKAIKDGSLGRTVQITARNRQEAASKVLSQNPDFIIPDSPQSITKVE
jgi:hypothetical protein